MAYEKLWDSRLLMCTSRPSYTESQREVASKKTLYCGSRNPGTPLMWGTPGITICAGYGVQLVGGSGPGEFSGEEKLKYTSLQMFCPLESCTSTVPLGSGWFTL